MNVAFNTSHSGFFSLIRPCHAKLHFSKTKIPEFRVTTLNLSKMQKLEVTQKSFRTIYLRYAFSCRMPLTTVISVSKTHL